MRKVLFYIMLLFVLNGCKWKRVQRLNIIKKLDWYNFSKESSEIKFERLKPFYNFFEGWKSDAGYATMTSPISRIRFFHFAELNPVLSLFIKKGRFFKNIDKLTLLVEINGKKIKSFFITTGEKPFRLTLEDKDLFRGENFISFVLDKKDRLIFEKYKTKRPNFLVKIRGIRFSTYKQVEFKRTKKGLIQPPNSSISFYFKAGKRNILRLSWRGLRISRGGKDSERVEIILRTSRRKILHKKTVNLTLRLERKTLKFNSPKPVIVELKLLFYSRNPSSRLLWKRIEVEKKPFSVPSSAHIKKISRLRFRPNIFFIVLDAARYREIKTKPEIVPNISRFTRGAFSFERFYSSAPYTSASIVSFMTGIYPEAHGIRFIRDALNPRLSVLSDELKKRGYYTMMISGSVVPVNIGLGERFHKIVYIGKTGKINSSHMKEPLILKTISRLTPDVPNFVYIHLLPPHEPYNPPPEFYKMEKSFSYNQSTVEELKRKYERELDPPSQFVKWLYRCYLNNLYYADHLVGKIIETLKSSGFYDKSIIIITADHGEAFFEHQKFGHNTTNYEDMLHVPFLLRMPDQRRGKSIKKFVLSNIDFAPTIYELLDIKPELPPQGISFAPVLLWKKFKPPERWLYSRAISHSFNLALFNGKSKYYFYLGREELYNLANDPDEHKNIYFSRPVISGFLRQKLFTIMKRNFDFNRKHRLKPLFSSFKKYLKELKSLGYL